MKYIFTFCLLMLGIIVDLVGQSTICTTDKSGLVYSLPGNPMEPYWEFENQAEKVDSVTSIISIQAYDDSRGAFRMDLCYYLTDENDIYYVAYLIDGQGFGDWYNAQPFFNTEGLYKLHFLAPNDGTAIGELLITPTGLTMQLRIGTPETFGFSDYVAYTSTLTSQPKRKLFSLMFKPSSVKKS